MAKMNVVVLNVEGSLHGFTVAILLIAKIVFDKEGRIRRPTGTYTRSHHDNIPNELHLEPRAGLRARRQFKRFTIRSGRRPPVGDGVLYKFWSRGIRKIHRISPFTRRDCAKKNNQGYPARRIG